MRCTCFTFLSSLASFCVLFWSFVRFELQLDSKYAKIILNAPWRANRHACGYIQNGWINTCPPRVFYSFCVCLWVSFFTDLFICSFYSESTSTTHDCAQCTCHFYFVKSTKKKLTHLHSHTLTNTNHLEVGCSGKGNRSHLSSSNLNVDIPHLCKNITFNQLEISWGGFCCCCCTRIQANEFSQEPNSKQLQPLKAIMLLLSFGRDQTDRRFCFIWLFVVVVGDFMCIFLDNESVLLRRRLLLLQFYSP